jgi:hypothetical protein
MIYLTLAHFKHFIRRGGFSSLLTNLRSTTVENSLQINPFYAKQSQFDGGSNEHKFRYEKQLQDFIPLAEPKNKANSKPIKPKTNPIKANLAQGQKE